jgi:aminopeptidase YwaD
MYTHPDPLPDKINAHLQRLCVDIGPRPGGSYANEQAARYIAGVFRLCGMDVEMQELPCPSWQAQSTLLEVDGLPLEAAANSFSTSCDVTAPAVAVATIAQLQLADLRGRIAILYGDLVANTLSPKSWFLKSDHDDRVIRLLEDKSPLAVLTVQTRLGELERLIEDWEFLIPSATVPARAGLALLAARDPVVRLRIGSQQTTGRTWNVIGRRPGAGENRIILCAHYDTKFDTPGALDNGGGVATILALADILGQARCTHSIECIAFANEDSGLPTGSEFYAQSDEAHFGDIVAVLNVDGAGHALDADTVAIMSHSTVFRDLVDDIKQAYAGIIWTDPWPESDHSVFAWRGVPCLAFTSPAFKHIAHLRCDTVEWVSPNHLAELVRFTAQVVDALQDQQPGWTRQPAS